MKEIIKNMVIVDNSILGEATCLVLARGSFTPCHQLNLLMTARPPLNQHEANAVSAEEEKRTE